MLSGGDTGWRGGGVTINAFWWGYRVEGGCNHQRFLVGIQGGGGGVTINAFWWGYRVEGGVTINAFWWGYRVEGGCNPDLPTLTG